MSPIKPAKFAFLTRLKHSLVILLPAKRDLLFTIIPRFRHVRITNHLCNTVLHMYQPFNFLWCFILPTQHLIFISFSDEGLVYISARLAEYARILTFVVVPVIVALVIKSLMLYSSYTDYELNCLCL